MKKSLGRREFFTKLFALNFTKTLDEVELALYSQVYTKFSADVISRSMVLFRENEKDSSFRRLPPPSELFELAKKLNLRKEISKIPSSDCSFCLNTGEVFVLWAGNDRYSHFNWETNENTQGMRIVKKKGNWRYSKEVLFPCSCPSGYRVWFSKKNVSSFEIVKKMVDNGYAISRKRDKK